MKLLLLILYSNNKTIKNYKKLKSSIRFYHAIIVTNIFFSMYKIIIKYDQKE